jgi:hypothetical protein
VTSLPAGTAGEGGAGEGGAGEGGAGGGAGVIGAGGPGGPGVGDAPTYLNTEPLRRPGKVSTRLIVSK